MIGAAEHGFVDTVRNLALICEAICSVNALPVVVRILAAPSTPIH
ncbi:transcription-repair coupling factor [Escherichia coli]|uniref:Transcription-repair coupling factor n=1 Tax=Escherichia coli TaxID=562 RepID=A0A377F5H2_ECOLX|nr:transcription-repair coupling factor [Escherichia coli]